MNDDLPPWAWNNDNSVHDHDYQSPQHICEDKHSDCAGKEMYCNGNGADWMNKNCQKTCKKCP